MWYIYTMKFHSIIKVNNIMTFVGKQIQLDIIISKLSPSQDKYISYLCIINFISPIKHIHIYTWMNERRLSRAVDKTNGMGMGRNVRAGIYGGNIFKIHYKFALKCAFEPLYSTQWKHTSKDGGGSWCYQAPHSLTECVGSISCCEHLLQAAVEKGK